MSPEAAGPDFLAARRLGLAPAAEAGAGQATCPARTGSETSRRLPPTSTTTRLAAAARPRRPRRRGRRTAGSSLTNSVSIQRVWTVNGSRSRSARGEGRVARPPRGGTGCAVAMPSTSNSASARAARCSACSRVAPVTISLASSESKAGPMTLPDSHAGVQADARAGRRGEGGDGAGGGQEAAARVLAVDAELEGVAAQRPGRRSRAPRRRRCGTSRGPGRCR